MAPDLNIIETEFQRLTSALPELNAQSAVVLGGIRASWDRATLPGKRLANAARHNIASYIMAFVGAAYRTGKITDKNGYHLAKLLRHAVSIEANATNRHVINMDYEPAQNWQGPQGGPWKTIQGSWNLTLIHTPNMPGGQWSVALNEVPCLFGNDPRELESDMSDLMSLVNRAEIKAVMTPRKIVFS